MKINDFKGTLKLFKLAIRRDRIKLPVWIICIAGVIGLITKSYAMMSPEEMREIVSMAAINPGMRLLISPVSAEGAGELGQFFLLRMSLIIAILIGIMNIKFVIRHTRGNEETGCQELIASGVAGKYSSLTGTLLLGLFTNLFLGVFISLSFIVNSLDISGAVLSGLSFSFLGILLCSVAAVTAQVSETSKGCSGIASMIMATFFTINSLGNVLGTVNTEGMGFESSPLVYFSPLGWVQQMHAFGNNDFKFLIPFPFLGILLISLAFWLVNKRDIGRGLIQRGKGREDAPGWMKSPLGIAYRLQRKTFFSWAIPLVVFGLIFGASSQEFADIVENIEMFELLKVTSELFLFAFIGVFAAIITIYTMQSLLRMRWEESDGPLENLLSNPVKRSSFALSHIIVSLIGSLLLLVVFTMSLALSAGNLTDTASDYMKIIFSQSGAITVVCGLVFLLYGVIPKRVTLISGIIVFTGIMAGPFFGAVLKLPEFLMNISPFTHASSNPNDLSVSNIFALFSLGIGLLIIGLLAFSRRNMEFQGEK